METKNESRNLTQHVERQRFRRKSFVFYCALYIFLGTASIVAGLVIGLGAGVFGKRAYLAEAHGLQVVCVILIGFGIIRIGVALMQLRRLYQRRVQK